RALEELQSLVRSIPEVARGETSGEPIRIPTGDGMALVFFRDPVAPVQCAMQIAAAVRRHPYLKLRMGLHSGPVYRVEDINANANVSGPGINLAERVMGCGDPGHILLSSAVIALLDQVGAWPIHNLGECEVKHGERVHLYSLYTDEVGNPEAPEKLSSRPSRLYVETVGARAASPAGADEANLKVTLLYKRGAQPDEELLLFLEEHLVAHGHTVFIDRHMAIGVEWAKEIERQIRTSDAVVPLLS